MGNLDLPEINFELPHPPTPMGLYETAGSAGNLVYSSGTTPRDPRYKGRLGENITTIEGKAAAVKAAINLLAIFKEHLGSLDCIEKLVKMNVYIAATTNWEDHSKLADGASEVIHKFLGERGKHARTAIGVSCLPGGTCVEIEAIVKISDRVL